MKRNKQLILSIAFALALGSCTEPSGGVEVKHTIIKKFKVRAVSVHDEISPRFKAVLDNGDTVPVGLNSRIGDTITYIYYDK